MSDYLLFLPSYIPTSCCNNTVGKCITMYQDGCQNPLTQYIRKSMLDIALVGFCSGLFQVHYIFQIKCKILYINTFIQIVGIVLFYYFYKAVKQDIALRAEIRRASRVQEGNPLNRQSSQVDKRASLTTR